MESRLFTETEPFSSIRSDRLSTREFDSDYGFDEITAKERARSLLGIDRTYRTVEDNPAEARKTLYGDRSAPIGYEEEVEIAQPEERFAGDGNRLFVGEAFGTSAFTSPCRYADPDELKPSRTTMQYEQYESVEKFFDADVAVERESAAAPAVKRKPLTRKQKISVAIYSSIVAVVAALIITTGAMIGAISANVGALKSETDTARLGYLQSVEQLNEIGSEEYLRTQAGELGMTEGGTAIRLDPIPETEVPTYGAPVNGFDKFCDWLSKVFG